MTINLINYTVPLGIDMGWLKLLISTAKIEEELLPKPPKGAKIICFGRDFGYGDITAYNHETEEQYSLHENKWRRD